MENVKVTLENANDVLCEMAQNLRERYADLVPKDVGRIPLNPKNGCSTIWFELVEREWRLPSPYHCTTFFTDTHHLYFRVYEDGYLRESEGRVATITIPGSNACDRDEYYLNALRYEHLPLIERLVAEAEALLSI